MIPTIIEMVDSTSFNDRWDLTGNVAAIQVMVMDALLNGREIIWDIVHVLKADQCDRLVVQ